MNLNITILGQLISFFLFVWFCMKFIWPPIISTIEKRQQDIFETLQTAEKIKVNLKLANNTAKTKIQEAQKKSSIIIREAEKKRTMILEAVELEAEKKKNMIISEAYSEIEIERKKVFQELQNEISNLAIIMAEKIIQNTLNNNHKLSIEDIKKMNLH